MMLIILCCFKVINIIISICYFNYNTHIIAYFDKLIKNYITHQSIIKSLHPFAFISLTLYYIVVLIILIYGLSNYYSTDINTIFFLNEYSKLQFNIQQDINNLREQYNNKTLEIKDLNKAVNQFTDSSYKQEINNLYCKIIEDNFKKHNENYNSIEKVFYESKTTLDKIFATNANKLDINTLNNEYDTNLENNINEYNTNCKNLINTIQQERNLFPIDNKIQNKYNNSLIGLEQIIKNKNLDMSQYFKNRNKAEDVILQISSLVQPTVPAPEVQKKNVQNDKKTITKPESKPEQHNDTKIPISDNSSYYYFAVLILLCLGAVYLYSYLDNKEEKEAKIIISEDDINSNSNSENNQSYNKNIPVCVNIDKNLDNENITLNIEDVFDNVTLINKDLKTCIEENNEKNNKH